MRQRATSRATLSRNTDRQFCRSETSTLVITDGRRAPSSLLLLLGREAGCPLGADVGRFHFGTQHEREQFLVLQNPHRRRVQIDEFPHTLRRLVGESVLPTEAQSVQPVFQSVDPLLASGLIEAAVLLKAFAVRVDAAEPGALRLAPAS